MDELVVQDEQGLGRSPRTRQQREKASNTNAPGSVILIGLGLCAVVVLLSGLGGKDERTTERYMSEVEYYQRMLDIERAEFDGYRAGVNESR